MATYHLQIVTPDGVYFDGQAEKLIARTTSGDVCIMAGHINYMAPLGMGMATLVADGKTRHAACIGGLLAVHEGAAKLVASTFEWAEAIDLERAQRAENRAEAILAGRSKLTDREIAMAEAKLKRSLVRQSVRRNG